MPLTQPRRLAPKLCGALVAPANGSVSRSRDPWADARLAIDQFAVKLAAACHELRTG